MTRRRVRSIAEYFKTKRQAESYAASCRPQVLPQVEPIHSGDLLRREGFRWVVTVENYQEV